MVPVFRARCKVSRSFIDRLPCIAAARAVLGAQRAPADGTDAVHTQAGAIALLHDV